MYNVNASKKTEKLKKAYVVNADKKTEKLKKCYVVGADKKLVKLWSGFTPAFLAEVYNSLYYSEDAVNWSVKKTFTHEILGMLYGNNKYYVAARYYQYVEFYTSEDGSTWTMLSRVDNYAMEKGGFKYLNGKFFMYDNNYSSMYYSSDCITWTAFTINDGFYNNSSYSSYTFGSVFDMEYGTVDGVTAYYVVRRVGSGNYSGCALCRYNTIDDLISGYDYETDSSKVLLLDAPSDISSFTSPKTDATLVINNNKIYVVFNYYCTSLDRYRHRIFKYVSGSWSRVQYSNSYIVTNIWSTKDKLIYDRMYYSSGRTYVAKMAFNYSDETAPLLTVPSYPCHFDIIKYPCVGNVLVGLISASMFYSLDGGSTFTSIAISGSNTSNGIAIYGSEDSGFYTER